MLLLQVPGEGTVSLRHTRPALRSKALDSGQDAASRRGSEQCWGPGLLLPPTAPSCWPPAPDQEKDENSPEKLSSMWGGGSIRGAQGPLLQVLARATATQDSTGPTSGAPSATCLSPGWPQSRVKCRSTGKADADFPESWTWPLKGHPPPHYLGIFKTIFFSVTW